MTDQYLQLRHGVTGLIRAMLCLACVMAGAGCAHRVSTQERLAGTWVTEWNFVTFTNTIAADGSYVCERVHAYRYGDGLPGDESKFELEHRFDIQQRGTWKVQGETVVNTTTNITSTRVKSLPVAYGHILKLNARELVIKWDNNDTVSVWKRER